MKIVPMRDPLVDRLAKLVWDLPGEQTEEMTVEFLAKKLGEDPHRVCHAAMTLTLGNEPTLDMLYAVTDEDGLKTWISSRAVARFVHKGTNVHHPETGRVIEDPLNEIRFFFTTHN